MNATWQQCPLNFQRPHKGKEVKDLANLTVPTNWVDNQLVAQFREEAGTFEKDSTVSYPTAANGTGPRDLMTISADSRWTPEDWTY